MCEMFVFLIPIAPHPQCRDCLYYFIKFVFFFLYFVTCYCSVDTWFLASSLTNRSTVIAIWFTIIILIHDIRGLGDKTYCYNLLLSNGYIFLTPQHNLPSSYTNHLSYYILYCYSDDADDICCGKYYIIIAILI